MVMVGRERIELIRSNSYKCIGAFTGLQESLSPRLREAVNKGEEEGLSLCGQVYIASTLEARFI